MQTNGTRKNDNNKTANNIMAKTQTVPVLDTKELFKGGREVKLFHHCQEYRLRITRNEKLILTK
jgi:hemin uptake protein HemP